MLTSPANCCFSLHPRFVICFPTSGYQSSRFYTIVSCSPSSALLLPDPTVPLPSCSFSSSSAFFCGMCGRWTTSLCGVSATVLSSFPYDKHGIAAVSVASSDSVACEDPLEPIFHKLNDLQNKIHNLQVAAPSPKGPPSLHKCLSWCCHHSGVTCQNASPSPPPKRHHVL